MVADPKKRLSASDALKHQWFHTQIEEKSSVINKEVLERLQSFRGVSKLKKAAMNMLIKMSDQKSIEELRKEFQKIDKDGSGLINADELKQAIIASDL